MRSIQNEQIKRACRLQKQRGAKSGMSEEKTESSVDDIDDRPSSFGESVKREAMEWARLLVVFIPVLFVFSLLGFEQRVIPSESMIPNLQVGDRVLVNKFSYGYSRYSIPWGVGRIIPTGKGRVFASEPERGDVIVFMHPHFRRVMIKRLIGLPGDRIQVRNEQVYLNDVAVPTEYIRDMSYIPHTKRFPQATRETQETHGDKTFLTHQWQPNREGDNTPIFIVPEGHFLFMGDNRDNSIDGRFTSGHCPAENNIISEAGCTPLISLERASVGFVPFDNLIGKGVTIAWTTKRCRKGPGLACPPKRVWKGL